MCDTNPAATVPPAPNLLEHMHDVAGKYYLHFSTVRTTATSLVTPIGILASITLLNNCKSHHDGRVALYFLGFIVLTTLFLNWVFSAWSKACRRLEKTYEDALGGQIPFNPRTDGFRTLFPQRVRLIRDGLDIFTGSVVVFGLLYIVLYYRMLPPTCRP